MHRHFNLSILVTALLVGLIFIAYGMYRRIIEVDLSLVYSFLGLVISVGGSYISWLFKKVDRLEINRALEPQSYGLPRVNDLENEDKLPTFSPEQLYIMQRLFQTNYQIHVTPLQGGFKNSGVFRVIEEPSQGNIRDDRIYVVKCLEVRDIRKEIRVYDTGGLLDRYRLPYTPGKFDKYWPSENELRIVPENTLGAVSYHLATLEKGSRLQTLTDFYRQHSFDEIEPYLRSLFDERLLPWYRQINHHEKVSLLGGTDGESERLYRNRERIQKHISLLLDVPGQKLRNMENIDITFLPESWEKQTFYNPIYWIDNVLVPNQAECFKAECRYSPVHGDLHMGNILIENGRDTHIWLIDFPDAHIGPAIIDFASLEANTKFRLLDEGQCSLEEWLGFETKLLDPLIKSHRITLVAPWHEDWQPENEFLQKAWNFIGFLRTRVVTSHLVGIDVRAYYLALLYATLPVVYRNSHTNFQKQCALASAAWMCEYLQ